MAGWDRNKEQFFVVFGDGDYYCQLCSARMNNEYMVEAHFSGKKHLKQLKKPMNSGWGRGNRTEEAEELWRGSHQSDRHQYDVWTRPNSSSRREYLSPEWSDNKLEGRRPNFWTYKNFPKCLTSDAKVKLVKKVMKILPRTSVAFKGRIANDINQSLNTYKLRLMTSDQKLNAYKSLNLQSSYKFLRIDLVRKARKSK